MLDDVMGRISKALFFGGAVILVASAFWTFLNWRDGGAGGAQMTASIVGVVGGAGCMGIAGLLAGLDTSFAG